ncbi:hypothetical protein DM01DRAFT_1264526, partial [Hesseltinella vesiculosa]
QGDSIYYDVKVSQNIKLHMRAFYELEKLFVAQGLTPFVCFPLRTQWSPCYMQIDTQIAHTHLLHLPTLQRINELQIFDTWDEIVNFTLPVFKPQDDSRLRFLGTMYTDGVGVTVMKQSSRTQASGSTRTHSGIRPVDIIYVHELTPQQQDAIAGRCVVMDPGRRDLLFTMHESSTPANKSPYRYTSMQQRKERRTKKY